MLTIDELKTPLTGPVSLTLKAGTCTAVSGRSGSGKSLFLRAIADLDESTGDIALNGVDRNRFAAPDWRRRVAYVPAESGWWAERVGDHFRDVAAMGGLLGAVGLAQAPEWQVSRLSSGERQRLALVRALETRPDVLLLDEPTAALDPASVRLVEKLILQRRDEGCAILLVTHDPEQPSRLGARHFRMNSGRLFPGEPGETLS